ncbi:hypothetical protein ACFWGN_14835 [Oerskovia sp. NPDC060338]|uniref:hypothetical protein n=1 Tax=Oerskovia sp. NPDC060338 TaxID=3347100 RepID=UPI0036681A42
MTHAPALATTPATKKRVSAYVTGASLAAAGGLTALCAGVLFALLSGNGAYRAFLAEQNTAWTVAAVVTFTGVVVALVGVFLLVRAMRPAVKAPLLAASLLAGGAALTIVLGASMSATISRYTIEASIGIFDAEAWEMVETSSGLTSGAAMIGVLTLVGALVWLAVIAIRSGARRVAASA